MFKYFDPKDTVPSVKQQSFSIQSAQLSTRRTPVCVCTRVCVCVRVSSFCDEFLREKTWINISGIRLLVLPHTHWALKPAVFNTQMIVCVCVSVSMFNGNVSSSELIRVHVVTSAQHIKVQAQSNRNDAGYGTQCKKHKLLSIFTAVCTTVQYVFV